MPVSVSLFSERHSPWCSTGPGAVDSVNSSGAVLVSTRLAQREARRSWWLASEHGNRNYSSQKVRGGGEARKDLPQRPAEMSHIPQSQCLKKRGRTGSFIFYSINTHSFFRFHDEVFFFFWQIGRHFWLLNNMTTNILLIQTKTFLKCIL